MKAILLIILLTCGCTVTYINPPELAPMQPEFKAPPLYEAIHKDINKCGKGIGHG
uniref:Uncharacterized protein n=1 Tax=viral metagenome TaxID=1070528 RepID=A0A6H1ZES1_9ZZZZ